MAGFLGAWFFITLAPTSSLLPIASEVGAERRMYLPLAGLVVAAVLGLYSWKRAATLAPYVLACVVAALAFGTVQRNREYGSKVALLQTTVDRWPHGRAHYNLALALQAQGRTDETIVQLRAALAEVPQANFALAAEWYARGQFDAASAALQTYLDLPNLTHDNVVRARNLLALSFVQQGKLQPAVDMLKLALQQDPGNPSLHNNLAFVLLKQGHFTEARQHYEEYLKILPGTAPVLTYLGQALTGLGDRDAARARFHEALALDPNYAAAQAGLSKVNDAR
jgi:tetratricopeptide (TPR) repeat protein